MPAAKLKKFLDAEGVKYVTITHSTAYTAQEIAASAHIRGKEMAKVVVVKLDGKLALAVLPAAPRVDLDRLRAAAGAREAVIASEQEFRGAFPECELGAMPPFGNLYGLEVFADERLAADKEIAFNAGSHTELVRLSFGDFQRLVKPRMVSISVTR